MAVETADPVLGIDALVALCGLETPSSSVRERRRSLRCSVSVITGTKTLVNSTIEPSGPHASPALAEILQQLGIMGLVARCQQRPAHRMQARVAASAVVDRQVILGQIVGGGNPSQVAGEVAKPLARS